MLEQELLQGLVLIGHAVYQYHGVLAPFGGLAVVEIAQQLVFELDFVDEASFTQLNDQALLLGSILILVFLVDQDFGELLKEKGQEMGGQRSFIKRTVRIKEGNHIR